MSEVIRKPMLSSVMKTTRRSPVTDSRSTSVVMTGANVFQLRNFDSDKLPVFD